MTTFTDNMDGSEKEILNYCHTIDASASRTLKNQNFLSNIYL